MATQITTSWSRDGYMGHDYNLKSQVDSNGVLTANAPSYEQVAGLIADIVEGSAYNNLPKDFVDYSDIIESLDTTEHNFFDMLPTGPKPTDVEIWWNQENLDSLEVDISSSGALSQVSGTSGYFTYGDDTTPGATAPVIKLSNVIDTTGEIGSKIRSGYILQNTTSNSHEHMLVLSLSDPTGGTGDLYLIRGYNAGGRLVIGTSKIPESQTTSHSAGDTLAVIGLITSEENTAPPSYRSGYNRRMNLIQIVDFSISEGFLESLFQRVNAPGHFKNPMQHSRDIHELQFYEVWNRNALFGQKGRTSKDAYAFYATGGLLPEIKKYCTSKWDGDYTGVGGYYDIDDKTDGTGTFHEYKCNGESNYRKGISSDPTTAIAFGEDLVNEANNYVITKLGNNGKNKRFIPTTIIGPQRFRRIFGQFTEDRLIVSKQQNATGGYYADSYITDNGNILKYVVDDTIGNRVLIGNPIHGKRRPLITLAMYKPPLQTRTRTFWFTSIMGFQWDYPEYTWCLWENVTST